MDYSIPVVIPDEVIDKIKYLCQQIPDHEWSGILFYATEGTIADKSLRITLKDIYPMDKGSSVHTAYDFNEEIVDYRMNNPETLRYRVGHIHSHNKMGTFFSGEDMSELQDNSEFHNYYLSVITNNATDFAMKIAFRGVMSIKAKDEEGNEYTLATEAKYLFIYDCKRANSAITVPATFMDRVKNIITKSAQAIKKFNDKYDQKFQKGKHHQPELPIWNRGYPEAKGGYGVVRAKNLLPGNAEDEDPDDAHDMEMEDFVVGLLLFNYQDSENIATIGEALQIVEQDLSTYPLNEYCIQLIQEYFGVYTKLFGELSSEEIVTDFSTTIQLLEDYADTFPFIPQIIDAISQLAHKYEDQLIITSEVERQMQEE